MKSSWESSRLLFFLVLNCSIIIPSESSTRRISLTCFFPKVESVFTFDFFFNMIWFILNSFGHQTLQKAVFDIVQWANCVKLLFERVWWESCLILFWVILCTPGIHVYCNYLLTTKVTALQVVRTSFQHSFISGLPRQSLLLFLTSHGIDPEYMSMIMCNLRGLNFLLCVLKK